MSLSNSDWNRRFTQQAQWTRSIRQHLLDLSKIPEGGEILDVGCGTGAVEVDWLAGRQPASPQFFGLDIRRDYLQMAARQAMGFIPVQGDARHLPFANGRFQASFCHFLLLWVPEPAAVIQEMARVTRPGGAVMAFAEPDYGGRIDFPPELGRIGAWQDESLRRQDADVQIGRKLRCIFHEAELADVESGVLGGRWRNMPVKAELDAEWAVIQSDLELLELNPAEREQLAQLKIQDMTAWQDRARILYVPLFYACGKVRA